MAVGGGQVSVMRNPGEYAEMRCFSSMGPPPSSSGSRWLAHLESILERVMVWKSVSVCLLLLLLSIHKIK